MVPPFVEHLPTDLATGRFPAGPLALAEVRYWRAGDGRLHGNAFCPRFRADPAGEERVILAAADPFDFCARCCDRLPEPGPPSYAALQSYVDLARGVAADADELQALVSGADPPAADRARPLPLGEWGRLAVLSARVVSLARRTPRLPEPLRSWGLALVARAEGEVALRRVALLAAARRAERLDGLTAALAAGAAAVQPGARRWRGRVRPEAAAGWLDAVGARLRAPGEATSELAERLRPAEAALVRRRAPAWEQRLARVAATAGVDDRRVVACRLDPAAGSAGGATLVVQATLARWGVPVPVDRPSRFAVVPVLATAWARSADRAGWLVDLGPAGPGDGPATLVEAASLWAPGAGPSGASAALGLARAHAAAG
ncbi:MAG: hypothetical protein IPM45_09990 [Acidimicrobiales bacterium]|nr:hypothetical protein [Acidimicrobiales bacterium]